MLASAIEAIPSPRLADSSLISKLIKIRSTIPEKIYSTSKRDNLSKKNVVINTSTDSSMNETENSEQDVEAYGCTSNLNVKEIYNCLHELDDQKSKEILDDYFYNDNFVYETNANQASGKSSQVKPKNRAAEFGEWQDGLSEWQATHAYPSFKNYIQSIKIKFKNRKNDLEFDPELGFFVPSFRLKVIQQKAPLNSSNMNSANFNTLNNPYASNKLLKELNRIALNQHDPSRRSSSAASNKRCLSIKPASLPFSASNENNFYSQLQLRSDELDRARGQKNFRLDYKSLSSKLAQEHLSNLQPIRPNQLVSLDEVDKLDSDEDLMSSKYTFHKSDSDSLLKNSGYLVNNNHSLNNISSKLLKVSTFSVNNQPLSANEILEKHKFYLDSDFGEINQPCGKVNPYKCKKPNHKPSGISGSSNNALYTHHSPKADTRSLDIDLSVTNSAVTSGSTTLPPIVSGKRINLPLGQHSEKYDKVGPIATSGVKTYTRSKSRAETSAKPKRIELKTSRVTFTFKTSKSKSVCEIN
ncbi:hypothetical protein BpHYR1_022497 [Brachionus plicatilis]|uniref:Uncharacterized protein n=1 Tax=Brachionus plicatilis TaxID=10195 RepID=A0A3M7R3G0_BRAPC|nr:hypothetical protein BpHYR1_022497 [Brachionus plicatilis]